MKGGIITILLLTLFQSSSAVMLSPPSYNIDSEPGGVYDCSFAVKNTAASVMDFSLYADGDLNASIKLSEDSARIEPNVWHGFTCKLTLPKEITPGLHLNSVVVMEGSSKGEMVGALAGVRMLLNVRKPYPGKYLEADLQVPDSEISHPVSLKLLLTSRGSEPIDSVTALFRVYDPSGELLATIPSDSISIPSGGVGELDASWTHDVAGVYHVVADVTYDGSSLRAEKDFRVGDLLIRIMNVSAPDSKPDGIAKVFVTAQSLWNEPIDNVYASLSVKDSQSVVVASADSPSTSFSPWESKTLLLYFDTSGLAPASYDLDVLLKYSNRTSVGIGVIRVVKPYPTTLVVLTAAIIIVLVLLILYFLRLRRGKQGSGK